jgi:hypothetical protein
MGLENKIRENKAFFEEEVSSNHLEKFQARLEQMDKAVQPKKSIGNRMNRLALVAASVIVLLFIAFFAQTKFLSAQAEPQLSNELMQVKMYYTTQTNKKIEQIKSCAAHKVSNDILFETTEDRLSKLDQSVMKLEHKLERAEGNKQLKTAYIQSLKAKSEVVDQMYIQMCIGNEDKKLSE